MQIKKVINILIHFKYLFFSLKSGFFHQKHFLLVFHNVYNRDIYSSESESMISCSYQISFPDMIQFNVSQGVRDNVKSNYHKSFSSFSRG